MNRKIKGKQEVKREEHRKEREREEGKWDERKGGSAGGAHTSSD